MQRVAGQRLKLGEVVDQVAVLVLGLGRHVVELPDVPLPDAQGEDLHALLLQYQRHGPGVAAVGVAVRDQKDGLGGVGAGVAQDLLSEGDERGRERERAAEQGVSQGSNGLRPGVI